LATKLLEGGFKPGDKIEVSASDGEQDFKEIIFKSQTVHALWRGRGLGNSLKVLEGSTLQGDSKLLLHP